MNAFSATFQGFSNAFQKLFFKTASELMWPDPCSVMSVYGNKMQDIKKKCSENIIEFFLHSKNGMVKFVSTKIKEIVVHSKPFIKIIGIFLLIVRFVRSSDQTILEIIRKNKSVLTFLINPSNCFTWTYLKLSQHLR